MPLKPPSTTVADSPWRFTSSTSRSLRRSAPPDLLQLPTPTTNLSSEVRWVSDCSTSCSRAATGVSPPGFNRDGAEISDVHRPVSKLIGERLPYTLQLTVLALLLGAL